MRDNDVQPGPVHIRACLLDAVALCSLLCAVGLAWGFDLAAPREPNSASRATLFAHAGLSAKEAPEQAVASTADNPPPAVPLIAPEPVVAEQAKSDKSIDAAAQNVAPNVGQVARPRRTRDVVAVRPPKADVVARPPTEQVRKPPKPELEIEFFQVKSHGKSAAFVVDCSSSMAGPRFDRACIELINAVGQLTEEQQFFIIFFNEGPVPLIRGEPARLVNATVAEQERFLAQLPTLQTIGGTDPEPALQEAIRLSPKNIYLLSDGVFNPINGQVMRTIRDKQIAVHTIAFEDLAGQSLLSQIATETGGTFRYVPPSADRTSAKLIVQILTGSSGTRVAALRQAQKLRLDVPGLYLMGLRSSNPEVEQSARKALQALAIYVDFGPVPGADAGAKARSVAGWRRWIQCRPICTEMEKWTFEQLSQAAVADPKPVRRLAALITIGQRRVELPRALFARLGDPNPAIRDEVIADLVVIVPTSNPGLNGHSIIEALIGILESGDPISQQSAARALDEIAARSSWTHAMPAKATLKEWKAWLLDESETRAVKDLELAKKLFDQKRFKPALARFREIEKEFPGTKSAQKAHDMAEAAERALGDGK